MKKRKLKEEAKTNLALFGIFLMIVVGELLISIRNQQLNQEMQKKTDSYAWKTQISRNNDFTK